VWAKIGKSFWPGYIYDPDLYPDLGNSKFDLSVTQSIAKKNRFLIYFYESDNFGLVTPRNLFIFNTETLHIILPLKNKTRRWKDAVALAAKELSLPMHLRLSWHITTASDMDTGVKLNNNVCFKSTHLPTTEREKNVPSSTRKNRMETIEQIKVQFGLIVNNAPNNIHEYQTAVDRIITNLYNVMFLFPHIVI
jgi:hypothetical protein